MTQSWTRVGLTRGSQNLDRQDIHTEGIATMLRFVRLYVCPSVCLYQVPSPTTVHLWLSFLQNTNRKPHYGSRTH